MLRIDTAENGRYLLEGTNEATGTGPATSQRAPPVARKGNRMTNHPENIRADYQQMLKIAIAEARQGLAEGGIPIGAALFDRQGKLLGRGHNRRIQDNDPAIHGETDAFRRAGRQRTYRDKIMLTTLAPCWYCSGLVRQFGIPTVIVGESVNFQGAIDWLRENGVDVIDLHSAECIELLAAYIRANPAIWNEDIGVD
jgi:cytosine/creatinine deaminase